jgi:hypothetical protein
VIRASHRGHQFRRFVSVPGGSAVPGFVDIFPGTATIAPGRHPGRAADRACRKTEIFSQAKIASGDMQRKSFELWLTLGKAVVAARAIADRLGGKGTFGRILDQQELGWLHTRGKTSAFHLEAVMKNLPKVLKWREGLDERSKIKWDSPQSIYLRCLRPGDRPAHGPRITPKPVTVREMLALPADEISKMLFSRCPSKAFAIMRSMNATAESGSAPKLKSGWQVARDRAAAAASATAAA